MLITQKRAYKSSSFLLKTLKNKDNITSKPGYITSKKVFKTAVERNKAKRRLKAAINTVYKANNKVFCENKMIFIINRDIFKTKITDLISEIKTIFKKSDIIKT